MSAWGLILSGAIVLAQICDDEPVPAVPGAAEPRPMSTASASIDNGFGNNGVARLSMSPGNDRFMAVTVAPDGSIYGAGFITIDGDQAMAVAKLTPAGAVDTSFGTNGVASVNVSPGKTVELA